MESVFAAFEKSYSISTVSISRCGWARSASGTPTRYETSRSTMEMRDIYDLRFALFDLETSLIKTLVGLFNFNFFASLILSQRNSRPSSFRMTRGFLPQRQV